MSWFTLLLVSPFIHTIIQARFTDRLVSVLYSLHALSLYISFRIACKAWHRHAAQAKTWHSRSFQNKHSYPVYVLPRTIGEKGNQGKKRTFTHNNYLRQIIETFFEKLKLGKVIISTIIRAIIKNFIVL